MRRIAIIFAVCLYCSTSFARVTPLEDESLSKAASAIASANICNFRVDRYALGRFLDGKIATKDYDGESVALAMYMVLGSEAMLSEFSNVADMSKTQLAEFCKKQFLIFGPSGTLIPGILEAPDQ